MKRAALLLALVLGDRRGLGALALLFALNLGCKLGGGFIIIHDNSTRSSLSLFTFRRLLLLLIVIFSGRGVSLVFGHRVQSALAAGATLAPLGLLLGLLLWRLVGRRDQHLRLKRDDWFFGQRSRTMNSLCFLRPFLKG